jgi:hypothetical protein
MHMLDWTRLSSHQTSPASSFEELCYQIARVKYGSQGRLLSIDDAGGGDGVEFVLDLRNGTEWGWQAKFYREGRLNPSRRRSIEASLRKAVEVHESRLKKWFLCIPLNLVIKGTHSEMAWFQDVLPKLAPGVELQFWGASELTALLQEPEMVGVQRYFFGDLVLVPQWFRDRFTEQRSNVGNRYDPELHTETDVEAGLHALCGDETFQARLDHATGEIEGALVALANAVTVRAPRMPVAPVVGRETQEALLGFSDAQARVVQCVLDAAAHLRTTLQHVKAEIAIGHVFEAVGPVTEVEQACNALRAAIDACREDVSAAGDVAGSMRSTLRRLDSAWKSSSEVRRLLQPDLHVFGEPGVGKSHLCCHTVHTCLDRNRPALLFLGSTFSRTSDLQRQILDQVGVPSIYGWDDFLAALNTCSAVYRTRALLILDGLNEAPEPGVWRDRLPGIIASVARFPHIALLTTCREFYREQIWEQGGPANALQAEGFEAGAVEKAVKRYLARFGLRADVHSGSLEAFRRPIYLALFCRTHQDAAGGTRKVVLETQSLYKIFDAYLSHAENLIRKRLDWAIGSLLKPKLIELAARLWETNRRALPLEEVRTKLDGTPEARPEWSRSLTYDVLEASLLVCRHAPTADGSEWVEFSDDLFAGYLIAQFLAEGRSRDEVEGLIRATTFVEAIASKDFEKRHPLHEDILRALDAMPSGRVDVHAYRLVEMSTPDKEARVPPGVVEASPRPPGRLAHRSILLDFNQSDRPVHLVDRRRLRIGKRFWLLPFFRKFVDLVYHRVWVEVDVPDAIQVRESTPLVEIWAPLLRTGAAELRGFRIRSEKFDYDIVLNLGAILDVTDDRLSHVELTIRVGHQLRPTSAPQVDILTVRLDLVHARPEFHHFLAFEPSFEAGYEHRPEDAVRLGTLYIENATPVRYAQPLHCRAVPLSEAPPLPGRITFGTPLPAGGDGATLEVGRDGELRLSGLAPLNRIAVPLLVDLRRVPNPDEVTELTSFIALEHEVDDTWIQHPPCEVRYRVQSSRSVAALSVALAETGSFRPFNSTALVRLEESLVWHPGRSGVTECFTLRIGNIAVGGSGRVRVRALRIGFDELQPVRWKTGGGFRVDSQAAAEFPQEYFFPSAVNSHQDFIVSFRHDDIVDVSGDLVVVRCWLSLEYREEDSAATEVAEWRGFGTEISFQVERDLGLGWLAVDFGTTAIAVAGPDRRGGVALIDLQQSLRRLLDERDYTPEQVPEFGTPFLSSNVQLLPAHCFDAPSRAKSAVDLAPLWRDSARSRFPLPHVKALLGTTVVPDLAGRLKEFVYRPVDGAELRVTAEYPIPTDALLRETYARLLTDYVAPTLDETPPRKVVISVPNGFTPRHAEQIRSLLGSRFPLFSREYVTFISESDAVTCFYVSNWHGLNHGRSSQEQEALRSGDEYVLIYDMGAGTLDLTYARIRADADGRREVSILGHMGRSTAGDYLDYVIAMEIYEQHQDRFLYPMFGPMVDPATLSARLRLKQIVQEQIKPALDSDGLVKLVGEDAYWAEDVVVDLGELRTSARVTDFLRESTTEVMENFFALFPARPGQPHLHGTVPLDTVVLSGRSTQWRLLGNAVANELKAWSGNDTLHVVDDLTPEARKSAVVLGASQFAMLYRRQTSGSPVRFMSRNLHARYGLLYRASRQPDRFAFAELLNPSTHPVSTDPVMQNGMAIYRYDTDLHDADPGDPDDNFVDLSQTPVAWFVQSFAADTAADANAGRWEYITRMAEFDVELVGFKGRRDRVPARIVVDENNQITFRLGQVEDDPVAPLRMNLNDSSTFRGGMWPFTGI